jgi:hypothetical protein
MYELLSLKNTFQFQVYVAMRMHHWQCDEPNSAIRRFNVEYMFWPEFAHAMVNSSGSNITWKKFKSTDCVFGGVDMGMSYM